MSLRERLSRPLPAAVPAVPAVIAVPIAGEPQKPQQPQGSESLRGTWLEGIPTLEQDREIRERVAAVYGPHPDAAIALELALNDPDAHLAGLRDVWPEPSRRDLDELHRLAMQWHRVAWNDSAAMAETMRQLRCIAPGRVQAEMREFRRMANGMGAA